MKASFFIKDRLYWGNSLVAQWLGLCPSTAGGMGSIRGWGIKIPQDVWWGWSEKIIWNELLFEIMSWEIPPTHMLCNLHSSSHTNKGTQNSRTPRHHNRETTWGFGRVSKEPPNLSNTLWSLGKYLLWWRQSGSSWSKHALVSTLPSRPRTAAECIKSYRPKGWAFRLESSQSNRAEGWVGGELKLTLSWCRSGVQGPEDLCPGQGCCHRTGNTLPFSLDFFHFPLPTTPAPPNPKNWIILTESSVDLKACKNLVQSPIACLTSSFYIWPNGITGLKADWGLPWYSSG